MQFFKLRFLARLLDYNLLFCVLSTALLIFDFNINFPLIIILTPILFIPIEALSISRFKTTMGKALFGIRISGKDHRRLSIKESFRKAVFVSASHEVHHSIGKKRLSRLIPFVAVLTSLIYTSALINYENLILGFSVLKKGSFGGQNVSFQSAEGGFGINFPSAPKVKTETFESARVSHPIVLTEYRASTPMFTYKVTYIDLPKKWLFFGSWVVLKRAIKEIVKATQGAELIEKKMLDYRGLPTLEYKFKTASQNCFGRLILAGNRLFQLSFEHKEQVYDLSDAELFFNSFTLENSVE